VIQIIWAPRALADMRGAWDYIAADNEAAADRTLHVIQQAGESLGQFPRRGRPGKIRATRELSVQGTHYFIVYKVRRSSVEIVRVVHGARDWPLAG
jgi:toxin ParE1/3/4